MPAAPELETREKPLVAPEAPKVKPGKAWVIAISADDYEAQPPKSDERRQVPRPS
jgi:hypothetical protein